MFKSSLSFHVYCDTLYSVYIYRRRVTAVNNSRNKRMCCLLFVIKKLLLDEIKKRESKLWLPAIDTRSVGNFKNQFSSFVDLKMDKVRYKNCEGGCPLWTACFWIALRMFEACHFYLLRFLIQEGRTKTGIFMLNVIR